MIETEVNNPGRMKDIFHLCVVLVQVVASCSLVKTKLSLLVLILAKNENNYHEGLSSNFVL